MPNQQLTYNYPDPPVNFFPFSKEININRSVEIIQDRCLTPKSQPKQLNQFELSSSFSNTRETYTWVIRSSGRRTTVIKYLFHKWLYGQLSKDERILFIEFPESVRNNQLYAAQRARH